MERPLNGPLWAPWSPLLDPRFADHQRPVECPTNGPWQRPWTPGFGTMEGSRNGPLSDTCSAPTRPDFRTMAGVTTARFPYHGQPQESVYRSPHSARSIPTWWSVEMGTWRGPYEGVFPTMGRGRKACMRAPPRARYPYHGCTQGRCSIPTWSSPGLGTWCSVRKRLWVGVLVVLYPYMVEGRYVCMGRAVDPSLSIHGAV